MPWRTLDGDRKSASRPDRFAQGERAADNHRMGGWVDPGAGLGAEPKEQIS